MRSIASRRSRSRRWSASALRALRGGVPLLVAAAAFSCTAYAPALDRDTDLPATTLATNVLFDALNSATGW